MIHPTAEVSPQAEVGESTQNNDKIPQSYHAIRRAEAMSREVPSLPVHPTFSQADLERLVEVVSQLQK